MRNNIKPNMAIQMNDASSVVCGKGGSGIWLLFPRSEARRRRPQGLLQAGLTSQRFELSEPLRCKPDTAEDQGSNRSRKTHKRSVSMGDQKVHQFVRPFPPARRRPGPQAVGSR